MNLLLSKLKTLFSSEHSPDASASQTTPKKLPFPVVAGALGAVFLFLIVRLFLTSPPDFLLSEDQKFEKFTKQIFQNELSGNTLSLHYTVADPSLYGIDTNEVSIGNASLAARKASASLLENYQSTLEGFQYAKLSEQHQLTYSIFHDYLSTELSGSAYLLYDEPLSPSLGVQAQLPVLLAEYTFRTKGDIENYLALLTQIPDYFSSILSFEQEKASAGLFMGSDCAVEVISQCKDFIADPPNNYLIGIFDDKIDSISNLTADEKIAYRSQNEAILNGYVIPAYQSLIDGLTRLLGSSQNDMGLYYYPEGQSYYRYLVKSITGDSRSVEDIEEQIKNQMVADYSDIQELVNTYYNNSTSETSESDTEHNVEAVAASAEAAVATASSDDPAAMLNELRQKITSDFPVPPDVSCNVKYVHPSLQEYLSPAFYLTPTIDDFQNNVIYINPASDYNELELYTTLAHEGYPGHLYQSVYFNAQSPDLLRSILNVGGYTEGWATYVEMYSYSLWETDSVLASLSQKNRSFTLGLASLLDIGIHYRGYTPEQTEAFLAQLGFSSDTAVSMYETILQAPGNYLQYYVGYLNFCSLRDTFRQKLGQQFSIKEFHRIILETGPAPFDILKAELEKQL